MTTKRYRFRVPIGDWSMAGHSQCTYFMASAAKPIDAVREAYFAAKKKLHAFICPESFCNGYEATKIYKEALELMRTAGAPSFEEEAYPTIEELAAYVVWYINQGDASIDVRLEETKPQPPLLQFSGYDEKKRHIGVIGYGLQS